MTGRFQPLIDATKRGVRSIQEDHDYKITGSQVLGMILAAFDAASNKPMGWNDSFDLGLRRDFILAVKEMGFTRDDIQTAEFIALRGVVERTAIETIPSRGTQAVPLTQQETEAIKAAEAKSKKLREGWARIRKDWDGPELTSDLIARISRSRG